MACPDGCWNGGGQLPLPPSLLPSSSPTTTTTARTASPPLPPRSSSDACTKNGEKEQQRGRGGDEKNVLSALERVVEKAGEWLTENDEKENTHQSGTCTLLSHPLSSSSSAIPSSSSSCGLPTTTTFTEEMPSDAVASDRSGDFYYAFAYSVEGLREAAEREKRRSGGEEEENDEKCLWECVFKDRRAEFEELLNRGGVHTLQW